METVFAIDNGLVMIVQSLVVYVIHCARIHVLDLLLIIVYHALIMRLGTSLVVVFVRCIGQTIIAHIMLDLVTANVIHLPVVTVLNPETAFNALKTQQEPMVNVHVNNFGLVQIV